MQNFVHVVGELTSPPSLIPAARYGGNAYKVWVKVPRPSGKKNDSFPLFIPEMLLSKDTLANLHTGHYIDITGELHSFREKEEDEHYSLNLQVVPTKKTGIKTYPLDDKPDPCNLLQMEGWICRQPYSPGSNRVKSMFTTNNAPQQHKHYVPLIAWNEIGATLLNLPLGTKVNIGGFLCEYSYPLSDGRTKTTHMVSIQELTTD